MGRRVRTLARNAVFGALLIERTIHQEVVQSSLPPFPALRAP